MARKSLVGEVADELLDRIIAGEFPPDSSVPGELELSARHDVSRMTVREAVKTLAAQNILRVEQGRGTFVNPLNRWSSLHAVLRATSEGTSGDDAAVQLVELRRMLETGACELAARRISDADLDALDGFVDDMREASLRSDLEAYVAADLAFHDVILHASENAFVAVLFEPLRRVLAERRSQTSAVPLIQEHAIAMHAAVAEALHRRDPVAARAAMDAHMQQTMDDLRTYVLKEQ
ncbi:GntR family transcriptional regulator [Sinomonas cyclohexanicum]|uniref:GntR family transcriptional regulator n=1 Tax=Sinomonas cyclohexanicum TaxID=322009 RepID=A0ABN6FMP2_SINCY|nr:FadR/GntR family transcriptional regulator [Corynebacterium cyclohexanicum]BCT77605.1 GntR family transcriptional regulator [Corynebacterium cyclohexanicum]